MKRFLADAVLIAILVSIGTYIIQKEDDSSSQHLETQMDQFEERVALDKELTVHKSSSTLNDIEDNAAGKLANKSSAFVVDVLKECVKAFSDIFTSLAK